VTAPDRINYLGSEGVSTNQVRAGATSVLAQEDRVEMGHMPQLKQFRGPCVPVYIDFMGGKALGFLKVSEEHDHGQLAMSPSLPPEWEKTTGMNKFGATRLANLGSVAPTCYG
jgi:hypothetical protein